MLTKGKKLRKNLMIVIAVVFAAVIVCATVVVMLTNVAHAEEEKVRDAAMNYIKTSHPDNASAMAYLDWEGGIRHDYTLGMLTYIYTSEYWTAIVQHPVNSSQTWTIEVVYTHAVDLIWWRGTYQSGTIAETSYRMKP
jgi:hypothetical protein